MSAGNQVLYSGALASSMFPNTTQLLAAGNFWIEEIYFDLAYTSHSAAGDSACSMVLATDAVQLLNFYWLAQPSAAGNFRFNIPVVSRPRIFVPRSSRILMTVSVSGSMTQVVYAITINGRTLP